MKIYKSYKALYIALLKEQGAAANLYKLRGLALHAFAWLVVTEIVLVAQIYPIKFFIEGLTNNASLQYLIAIAAVIAFIYFVESMLYLRMDHFRIWAMWLNFLTILGYCTSASIATRCALA